MVEFSPVESKIIKQIEYYFGDVNLQRDKFLLDQMKLDDGWVPLDTMLKFNRLSQMTTDKDVIINALKKVVDALVEVHDDGTKIRRTPDKPVGTITKEYLDERKKKTVYAKGFPLDASLDSLIDFFEKFGPTEQVLMRKDATKQFKGSCFVVYKNEADAKAFLESDVTFLPDQNLIRLYKQDYFKNKSEEAKKKLTEIKLVKAKAITENAAKNIVHGSVMDILGFKDGTNIKDIKTFLLKHGKVMWVDFEDKKARVRFDGEGEAAKVIELLKSESAEGKIIFDGQELECKILDEEEEKAHWLNIMNQKKNANNKKGKFEKRHNNDRGQKRGKNKGGPNKKFKKKDNKTEIKEEENSEPADNSD